MFAIGKKIKLFSQFFQLGVLLLLAGLFQTNFAFAATPQTVPNSLQVQINVTCQPDVLNAIATAQAFCIDPGGIVEQIMDLEDAVSALLTAGLGLVPLDLAAALERALRKCMKDNPILSLLNRYLALLKNLTDISNPLDGVAQCAMNALESIFGSLLKSFLGPILKFVDCLTKLFDGVIKSISSVIETLTRLVNQIASFIANIGQRVVQGAIRCVGVTLSSVVGDCVKLGLGFMRSFDYLKQLTGIALTPLGIVSDIIKCINEAAKKLTEGPLKAIQLIFDELAKLQKTLNSLLDLLHLTLPDGRLGIPSCDNTVGPGADRLQRLRNHCSRYRRAQTALRRR